MESNITMKRKIAGLSVLILMAAFLAVACSSGSTANSTPTPTSTPMHTETAQPSTTVPDEVKEPGSKGFLWKISGGKNPGYLAGTIHVARKAMYPLDPDLELAIEESDFVALELDLTKVDQMKTL